MTLLPSLGTYSNSCPCCGALVVANWKNQTGAIYCSPCARGEHNHQRWYD
ncbi:MAG: hypothetical protein M3O91_00095 [Chloroflexota bacterium]|nr:hypothetical protein [Chloroflexota bacterium]